MNTTIENASVILIFLGSVMAVISAFGILRLPDVYTRSHAATKSSTLAVLLSLTGAFIFFWTTEAFISIRLLLGIVFVFITAPVAGHIIIRAAYRSNVKLADSSTEDALGDFIRELTGQSRKR